MRTIPPPFRQFRQEFNCGTLAKFREKTWQRSDTAPHRVRDKECAANCAGIISAPVLPELLAQLFDERDALGALPGFVSQHGTEFYRLRPPGGALRLVRQRWRVPDTRGGVVLLLAGSELEWCLDAS